MSKDRRIPTANCTGPFAASGVVFTKLDFKQAYLQLEVDKSSQPDDQHA